MNKRNMILAAVMLIAAAGVRAGAHSASSALVTVDTRDSAVWSLAAPTGVKATTDWPTAVVITWNAVYGAAGYEVWRGKESVTTRGKTIAKLETDHGQYSDTEPPLGQVNYYWVKAVSGTHTSVPSLVVVGFKNADTVLMPPVWVTASTNLSDKVIIEWQASEYADYYVVYRNEYGIEKLPNYNMIKIGEVPFEGSKSRYSLPDEKVIALTKYYYYVEAVKGKSRSRSLYAEGYAQGIYDVNKSIEWDIERVASLYGDYNPVRAVQVVDTKSRAIRTGHPFAVRAFLKTPSKKHATVHVKMKVCNLDDNQEIGVSDGYVFQGSEFWDWTSSKEVFNHSEHYLPNSEWCTASSLMARGYDAVTAVIHKSLPSGKHKLGVSLYDADTDRLICANTNEIFLCDETEELTVLKASIGIQVEGSKTVWPKDNYTDDELIETIRAIFPYKTVRIVTVPSAIVSLPSTGTLIADRTIASCYLINNVLVNCFYSWIVENTFGQHVVALGILPSHYSDNDDSVVGENSDPDDKLAEFFRFFKINGVSGWHVPYVNAMCVVNGDDFPFGTLVHELGHESRFSLGESYDLEFFNFPFIQFTSEYNPKAINMENRDSSGNFNLPSMGCFNAVLNGTHGDFPPFGTTAFSCLARMRNGTSAKLGNSRAIMGKGGQFRWPEWNEYKRICEVLLPDKLDNESVSSMSMLSARAEDVIPMSETLSYTGAVVMATALVAEGGEAEIWPLLSLGQMEVSESVTSNVYSFVMLDAGSNVLDRIWFGVSSGYGSGMGSAIVPYRPESHILQLVSSNGVVLAEKVRSANAPTCTGVACTATNDGYRIVWTGSDADGDTPHWSSLYYAREGTNFLGPIILLDTNSSVSLPAGIVPGGTGVVWKVVVSDGFNFGVGLSSSMTVSNVAPSCGFASGSSGYVLMGVTNVYTCYTSDPEDGQISGADVSWYQDGLAVTTGYQASVCFVSEGWHTLEIVCRDSEGATGSRVISAFAADTNATPVAAVRESSIVAVPGASVTLESLSTDPNGDPLTHMWQQIAGTNVTLTGAAETNAVFVMPEIEAGSKLTFRLTVSDGSHTGFPATVTVTYYPQEVTLSVPQIEFPYDGGRTSLTVQVAYDGSPWTVQCTSEWVRLLSPSSNSGYGEVWLEAEANTGGGRETLLVFNDKTLIVQQNGDTDGDGMPDAWERRYGLNPNSSADAVLDPDGDSLSNLAEYHAGTNPNNRDTDGDTLPDGWELVHGFSPLDVLWGLNGYAGMFRTGGTAEGVAVAANLAYVADGTNGLVILDVSESTNIVQVGTCALEGFANGIAVNGGRAYVTCGTNGLAVVNVGDATNPAVLSVCALDGVSRGVCGASNFVFVASGEAGVHVVGVGEGGVASLVATFDTEGTASGVALAGSSLYVADGTGGLLAVDVGTPASPALQGSCALYGSAMGICVTGTTAYVAMGEQGLATVDIAVPSLMTVSGVCDTPGYALGVEVAGGFAFVADGGCGLQIADAGVLGTNILRGSADTPGWAKGVCARGGLAYVADGAGGLQIVQIAGIDENQNGISDSEEIAKLEMLVDDPLADSDGDGISNWGEHLVGMNMNSRDSDGDGMPDGWEVAHLLNPTRNDSLDDLDGDGFNNSAEYAAGTDPRNPHSLLRMDGLEIDGPHVIIHWRGGTTVAHELLRATSLASNDWQVIETHYPPTPTTGVSTDVAPPSSGFYLLRVKP